jgi:hypothetical protein
MENTTINCPKCEESINVNEIMYNQMHSQLSREFNAKLLENKKVLEQQNVTLEKEKADLLRLKSEIDTTIALGVNKRLSSERVKQEKMIREQLHVEKSDELNSYKEQLDEKVKEVKELNKLKAEFQKLHREKTALKEKIEAEAELRITAEIEQERKKIRKDLESKNELLVAEKEHVIQQLKTQLIEASRKADQGSGQLRGEVMETNLEDYLRLCFPMDTIEEIKKGTKGGDSIHFVHSAMQQNCGSIYYETKRTKDFQPSWIPKFKADMRARNADIGVLVTETYPKGVERLSLIEGIWICSREEAKGLCYVLRESLIRLNDVKAAQVNKGGKMEIIYEYMVSNEFRMQMEAIVEAFTTMQKNLLNEKRAMEALWKQRQKEIEKVILNATHIYSSIRGIAGSAVKSIRQLELTAGDPVETKTKNNVKLKTRK